MQMKTQMEGMHKARYGGRDSEFSQHLPETLQTLYSTFGIFMEASSHRHDWSLTPFLTPLPSVENEEWAENVKLLIMVWTFWWPAPIQEPPVVLSLEQRILLSLRKFQGI